jgi:hypothetical protein
MVILFMDDYGLTMYDPFPNITPSVLIPCSMQTNLPVRSLLQNLNVASPLSSVQTICCQYSVDRKIDPMINGLLLAPCGGAGLKTCSGCKAVIKVGVGGAAQ